MINLPPNPGFCCGKLPAVHDPRTLRHADYLDASPPAPPPVIHWATKVPHWPAFWNHKIGTCEIARALHTIQVWTSQSKPYNEPPDYVALQLYETLGGYKPGDKSTDNGVSMLALANYWAQTGLGLNHHKITGYASLNAFSPNIDDFKRAIWQFGAVGLGFTLPPYVFSLWADHQPWTNETDTTLDGTTGHALPFFGYDANWFYTVNAGRPLRVAWDFIAKYIDEGYVYYTNEWKPLAPFNAAKFKEDKASVTASAA